MAVLVGLILGLLATPAGALAAPPTNDDFEDRLVIPNFLPTLVSTSNVEATKEEGEFIPGLSPAGHSVWFEWEATATKWMTIGACDSSFPALVAIFTGSELKNLTQVVSGNASEGPDCPYAQRQYTFKAISGTKYVIAVDGNNFHLPESPPPVTEGDIRLYVEETPAPPNDDFEFATVIKGSITEEPGGARFYFANVRGFTWTATTEPGEPEAGFSGASVWYSWTAPEDATYHFGHPCCGGALSLNRDVYFGDEVDELAQVLGDEDVAEIDLSAGETVRIRISGPLDPETEEPVVGNFDFNVSAKLAPLPPKPEPEGGGAGTPPPETMLPDTTAPETFVTRRKIGRRVAKFWFASNETDVEFLCKWTNAPVVFAPAALHMPL